MIKKIILMGESGHELAKRYNDGRFIIVESLKDGVVITSFAGAHAGANAVSGDFSLQVSGYRVKDGKIVQPMALVTGAHNFLELLKMIIIKSMNLFLIKTIFTS